MKCPHCLSFFHEQFDVTCIGGGEGGQWKTIFQNCPGSDCYKSIVYLKHEKKKTVLVYPKSIARNPLPEEFEDESVRNDYTEASLILTDSPKASAALSRRSLQYILREKANVKHASLYDEIQEVVDSNTLPSDIAENLDAVRVIGNFAAHPIKSKNTGEIVDVEPEEAEWNLDVLDQMIDFYYVKPAIAREKKDKLNAKLAEAGKPTI